MAAQFDTSQEVKTEGQEARQEVKGSYEAIRADIMELASSVRKLAGSEFGGVMEGAQETAQMRVNQLERAIREKPMQAALVAAGAGFLVGLLISR